MKPSTLARLVCIQGVGKSNFDFREGEEETQLADYL